jgi:hypothetical protein
MTMTPHDATSGVGGARRRRACPSEEILTAYLTAGCDGAHAAALTEAERAEIGAHVDACDGCLLDLQVAQHRLSIAEEIGAPVPASVRGRIAALSGVSSPRPRPASAERWIQLARSRAASWLRLPILAPAAMALIAIVVLGTQIDWMHTPARELSRSVMVRERLRVTAPEALVRPQPESELPQIATLRRGAQVEVVDERGSWYRVVMSDGTEGWMERRAFE